MRIEELSAISFGAVRQLTYKPDSAQVCRLFDGDGTCLPTAEFLTYVFYGAIPSRFLVPESVLHGVLTVRTEEGLRLKIERKTEIDALGIHTEYASVTDLGRNEKIASDEPIGNALFGVDASLFLSLISLGTVKELPEQLTETVNVLLSENATKEQILHTVRRIDEASSSLLRPNRKSGAIYEVQKKLTALEEEIDASNRAAKHADDLKAELGRTEEEKGNAALELAKLLELENARKSLSVIREYDSLHALEDSLDAERAAYDRFLSDNRVGSFLPTESYGAEIADLQSKVTDTVRTYTQARAALTALEKEEEHDEKAEAYLETARKKYGGFDTVRRAACLLFRRASHTVVFTCVSLFAAAFFAIGSLITASENVRLSLVLLLIAICCAASSLVLFFSRRRFENALLILCREFGAKNRDELLARLQFLENENARKEAYNQKRAALEEEGERAKKACADTLAKLDGVTVQWGRRIDPSQALHDFDVLLSDVRQFLETERAFRERIREKEIAVSRARKKLADQSEIAVRARVSPVKRENLCKLEEENRLSELDRGIAFYNSQIARLDARIEDLSEEHDRSSSQIGATLALSAERDRLAERLASMVALHRAYATFRAALLGKSEGDGNAVHLIARYREIFGKEDGNASALCTYFALCTLLLHDRAPIALNEESFTDAALRTLLAVCGEENRQLFADRAESKSKLYLSKGISS